MDDKSHCDKQSEGGSGHHCDPKMIKRAASFNAPSTIRIIFYGTVERIAGWNAVGIIRARVQKLLIHECSANDTNRRCRKQDAQRQLYIVSECFFLHVKPQRAQIVNVQNIIHAITNSYSDNVDKSLSFTRRHITVRSQSKGVYDIFWQRYRGQQSSERCDTVGYAQSKDDAVVCYLDPAFGAENDINDCR